MILHDSDGKSIVPLAAHGLDRGGVEAGFGGDDFVHAADALDGRVGVGGVDYGSVTDDVVANDERAGMGEPERPFEIAGVVPFIGIDKNEIKRSMAFGCQLGQGFESLSEAEFDNIIQTCAGDVCPGDLGVFGVGFEGDELAVCG